MFIRREVFFRPANENRALHIYLPDDYYKSNERYPVMYFFDGHNIFFDHFATFGKSWGLDAFMHRWGKKMIVVGIECSHVGIHRLEEYNPYTTEVDHEGFIVNGHGVDTLDWMVNELKPVVDKDYRTLPFRETTAIGGASMGGLMSLYGIIRYNRYFSKAACLSNSILDCMKELHGDLAVSDISPDTRIYLSAGTDEMGEYSRELSIDTEELARSLSGKGAVTDVYIQPEGHHCEADWEKQNDRYMNFLWCA